MARPTSIDNAEILRAAREVFLERGVQGTAREVALLAGCSEGTIFHRFGSKMELFREAMRYDDDEPAWIRILIEGAGYGDVRETMELAGLAAVRFFERVMPLSMMSWSAPQTRHRAADSAEADERDAPAKSKASAKTKAEPASISELMGGPRSGIRRGFEHVKRFFEIEMAAGRIRDCDPDVIARVYTGTIVNFVFFGTVFEQEQLQDKERFIKRAVALLWDGIAP